MAASRITLVVAMDRHGAIGKDDQVPWHLKDDLQHFKSLTLNHPVLMGRKTFESIGRALPKRRNLVLTRDDEWKAHQAQRVGSFDEAVKLAGGDELMVIGGAQVYALALPHAHRIVMTRVDTVVKDADVYFPYVDHTHWKETDERSFKKNTDNDFRFTIRTVERISRAE